MIPFFFFLDDVLARPLVMLLESNMIVIRKQKRHALGKLRAYISINDAIIIVSPKNRTGSYSFGSASEGTF